MTDVDPRRKQKSILLIGVLGIASALIALVLLLGGRGDRSAERAAPSIEATPASSSDARATSTGTSTGGSTGEPGSARTSAASSAAKDVIPTQGDGRSALLTGPVHGRVVDERTREPVPFVDVHLVSSVIDELVQTKRDGTFESSREFAGDKLTALVTDAGYNLKEFVRKKDMRVDDPWTLEVPIGPTYPLSIDARAAIEPALWSARVLETTRNFENAGEIDVDEHGLQMFAPLPDAEEHAWPWMPLRGEAMFEGDIPWLRYPSIYFPSDPRYRLRIQVRCESLGRKGQARIHATVGVHDPVIVDGLKNVGTLSGKLVDAQDVAVNGATVLFRSQGVWEKGDSTPQWEVAHSNEKGEFQFHDLLPGHGSLLAFAPKLPLLRIEKLIVATGVTVLEESLRFPKTPARFDADEQTGLGLDPAKEEAAASRRKGHEKVYAHLRLTNTERFVPDWVQSVWDISILERQAHFEAAHLPAASFDVDWLDLFESRARVHPPIAPARMTLSSPQERLKLEYITRDARELSFEIEGDDERMPMYDVSFEPGGLLIGEQNSYELRRWSLARGAPVRWVAWRRGCAPVFGDEDHLSDVKGKQLSARIRFTAGWGVVLWCRATDGMPERDLKVVQGLGYSSDDTSGIPPLHKVLAAPPLQGVRVLLDGTLAGTTDEEGFMGLAQRTLPARLVLVADHWHMLRLERLPQHCAATQRYVVWMARD